MGGSVNGDLSLSRPLETLNPRETLIRKPMNNGSLLAGSDCTLTDNSIGEFLVLGCNGLYEQFSYQDIGMALKGYMKDERDMAHASERCSWTQTWLETPL